MKALFSFARPEEYRYSDHPELVEGKWVRAAGSKKKRISVMKKGIVLVSLLYALIVVSPNLYSKPPTRPITQRPAAATASTLKTSPADFIGMDTTVFDVEASFTQPSSDLFPRYLSAAITAGNTAVAAYLINQGVNANAADPTSPRSFLHRAAYHNRPDICALLISAGASVEATDPDGKTPLFKAVENSSYESCNVLLQAGANPATLSLGSNNILNIVKDGLDERICGALLNCGASVSTFADAHFNLADSNVHSKVILGAIDIFQSALLDQPLAEGMAKNGTVNATDGSGNTPLHHGTTIRSSQRVNFLLNAGANIFYLNSSSKSPVDIMAAHLSAYGLPPENKLLNTKNLFLAVLAGNIKQARSLVNQSYRSLNASITATDNLDKTPIHYATSREMLAALGITDLDTTLVHAASNDDTSLTTTLLELGVSMKSTIDPTIGFTPLHYAAYNDASFACTTLLKAGASPFVLDNRGNTPKALIPQDEQRTFDILDNTEKLLTALQIPQKSLTRNNLQALISQGAVINATDVNGLTALHLATQAGRKDLCIFLLRSGVNVDAVSDSFLTSLPASNTAIQPVRTIKKLFAQIAGQPTRSFKIPSNTILDATNAGGETLLLAAVRMNNEKACNALLAHGTNIFIRDATGMMPLHRAAQNGNRTLCQALLAAGAAINVKSEIGLTPLHYAARGGFSGACQVLAIEGADTTITNGFNQKASDIAVGSAATYFAGGPWS